MKKAIIFDFMRTLYDADKSELFSNVPEILEYLKENYDLYLITRMETDRDSVVASTNIHRYFKKYSSVETKNAAHFKSITSDENYDEIFVIGDRLNEEIRIGNFLSYKTIWLKKGKFSNEGDPQITNPWRTISDITEIREIL